MKTGNPQNLRKGGGRPKGVPNKVSREIRELAGALFDAAYWERCRARLLSGRIAPAVEAKLLAYAYGEPKQQVELSGNVNVATTVVHEYHAQ